MAWEVVAVSYATLQSTKSRMFLRWESYSEPDAPRILDYYFWVLRNGSQTVVVDTGFAHAVGLRRGRDRAISPEAALRALGVDPALVDMVVLTHLHWDHVGNVGLFQGASIAVPGVDLDFWSGPFARRPQFAEHVEPDEIAYLSELERTGRAHRYDGESELLPGINLIHLPGHSAGLHGLLVQTDARPVFLASDAIHFYEEFESDRPFAIFDDLAQTYASYDRVRELCETNDAILVPGHDPAVAERFPSAADMSGGRAVRLS